MPLRVVASVFPFIAPLIRLALSVGLVKVLADEGGYAHLDALALAAVHASFAVIPGLPWLGRLRAFLGSSRSERRGQIAWAMVLPAAGSTLVVFFALFGIAALLAPGLLPRESGDKTIYFLVLAASSASTSLLVVEYICGRFALQARLRLVEIAVFVILAGISLAASNAFLAASAIYLSSLTARMVLALWSGSLSSTYRSFGVRLLSVVAARRFLIERRGWMIVIGNLAQCLSSAVVYSYAFQFLTPGVLAQVSLAYRFAGPMQLLSGQLAYVTWKKSDVKKGALLAVFMFSVAAALTLILPFFFRDFLRLEPSANASVLGLISCAHIAMQGFCQIKGSYFYSIRAYQSVALSSAPHGFVAVLAPILISTQMVSSPTEVILLLLAPTLAELAIILAFRRHK